VANTNVVEAMHCVDSSTPSSKQNVEINILKVLIGLCSNRKRK